MILRRSICISVAGQSPFVKPRFAAFAHLRSISKHEDKEFTVRNFVCVIHQMQPDQALVETEVPCPARRPLPLSRAAPHTRVLCPQLFPRGALEYYTAKNMG